MILCSFYTFRQFVRSAPVETVGKKSSGVPCVSGIDGGRPCRGRLHDGVLDWEHSLPENDLLMSEWHSRCFFIFFYKIVTTSSISRISLLAFCMLSPCVGYSIKLTNVI